MTEWVATAFAVHPEFGLGVGPGPTGVRTFSYTYLYLLYTWLFCQESIAAIYSAWVLWN